MALRVSMVLRSAKRSCSSIYVPLICRRSRAALMSVMFCRGKSASPSIMERNSLTVASIRLTSATSLLNVIFATSSAPIADRHRPLSRVRISLKPIFDSKFLG